MHAVENVKGDMPVADEFSSVDALRCYRYHE